MSATTATTTLPHPTAVDAPDVSALPRPETPESLAQLLGAARNWAWPEQTEFVPLWLRDGQVRSWPAGMWGFSLRDSIGYPWRPPDSRLQDRDAPAYHQAMVAYVMVVLASAAISAGVDETGMPDDSPLAEYGLLENRAGGYWMRLASADAVRSVDRADLWRWAAAHNSRPTGPASAKARDEAMAAALPGALVTAQYARDVVQLHHPFAEPPPPPTPKRKGLSWR